MSFFGKDFVHQQKVTHKLTHGRAQSEPHSEDKGSIRQSRQGQVLSILCSVKAPICDVCRSLLRVERNEAGRPRGIENTKGAPIMFVRVKQRVYTKTKVQKGEPESLK